MLRLRRAGATIVFAAPGFYGRAESVQDLVDFVVARVLDQLGVPNTLAAALGAGHVSVESGRLAPDAVRTMFDRIAPVYDAMNRVMTAGLDQSWRRATARAVVVPGEPLLDACCGTGDLAVECARLGAEVTGARLLGAHARARAAARRPS